MERADDGKPQYPFVKEAVDKGDPRDSVVGGGIDKTRRREEEGDEVKSLASDTSTSYITLKDIEVGIVLLRSHDIAKGPVNFHLLSLISYE